MWLFLAVHGYWQSSVYSNTRCCFFMVAVIKALTGFKERAQTLLSECVVAL